MKKRKLFGFSLVEAMSMLVISSIVIAVFAPIITSHLKNQDVGLGAGDNRCNRKWPGCQVCTMTECTACPKNCSDKQYLKISDCTCYACSANCLECVDGSCLRCAAGYYASGANCNICEAGYFCDGIIGRRSVRNSTYYCVSKDGVNCNTGTGSTMEIQKVF